jgi:DNA polymerase-1
MAISTGKAIPYSNLALEQWINLLEKATIIGFDTENQGLKVYSGEEGNLGFSIAFRSEFGMVAGYFPCKHIRGENLEEGDWKAILDIVTTKTLVLYNAVYDLSVLHHMGYTVAQFFCAQRIDHLINENHPVYSLDATSKRWLGYEVKEKSPEFELALLAYGWPGLPAGVTHDYAKTDASGTLEVFEAEIKHKEFRPEIVKYWKTIEAPAINLLGKMRRRGVRIDVPKCRYEQLKGEQIMVELEDALDGKPSSPLWLKKTLLDEMGLEPAYKINPKGEKRITFDKAAMEDLYEPQLERLSADSDLAEKILQYRGWQKAVSGYYIPYQRFVESDGRLRAEYKPHGTVTGRFSCANPNLQQIPKETNKPWNGAVKSCLIAAEGYKLWELDYSQLEFRLAASAAKEESLLEIFNDDSRDVFSEMAAQLGMERNPTKTLNYTIQYGGGVGRIKTVFGVSASEAKAIIDNYYSQYPNLKKASKMYGDMARRQGYIDIWSGRRRHFRKPKEEHYKAFNSYIQGGASDIVKKVMVMMDQEGLNNEDCRILLQVHDSIVPEIKIGMEDFYLPKLAEVMTRLGPQFGVNLAIDAHSWVK